MDNVNLGGQSTDNQQSCKSLDRLDMELSSFPLQESGNIFNSSACHLKKRQRSVSDPTPHTSLKQPLKSFSGSFRAVPYPTTSQQFDLSNQYGGLKLPRGQTSGNVTQLETALQEAANKLDLNKATDLRRKIFPRLTDTTMPRMKFSFSSPYRKCSFEIYC